MFSYWFSANHFKSGYEDKFNLLWLFILATLIIFTGIGLRDPWPADEPRFAQVAREMVEGWQWFFPMRGGELYPDKPPIFMWSIAIFYLLTGSLKVAFLLPSAFASLLTLFLVYDLGKRLWSSQAGWYSSLLLLLCLQFTLQAKTAQIDAMVCCWIVLGCYGLLRHLLLGPSWRWYYIAWFFMGLGVITKGVGFLPLLMLVPYAITQRWQHPSKERGSNEGWRWALGPLVMLGAISLWFVPMLLLVEHYQTPLFDLYRDNILLKQTVTRYSNSWHHIKPFWYYIVSVIPIFWLPLSLLLPWLAHHWYQAIKQADRRIILPLGWALLVLLFFSISPGKRGVYVFPMLPMLALISGPYLREILSRAWPNRLIWLVVLLLSALLTIAAGAGFADHPKALALTDKFSVTPWNMFLVIGLAGFANVMLSHYFRKGFISWLGFLPLLWLIYSTWGYHLLNPVRTPKHVYANLQQVIPDNSKIALVGTAEQFLLFSPYQISHFGYHTPEDIQLKMAWHWMAASLIKAPRRASVYVLTDAKSDSECFDMSKAVEAGFAHRVHWVLLDQNSLLPDCPDVEPPPYEYHYKPGN